MTHAPDATRDGLELPELRLKPREDRRLAAGHLWIFSNEVDTAKTPLTGFASGALCRVVGDRDRFLGYAYVNPHALICARILSRDGRFLPGKSLVVHRLQVALALRERLYAAPYYRLVYGESDGLPGLVLDRFGDVIVAQAGTAGMEAMKDDVVEAVRKVIDPRAFIWKNDSGARELEGLPSYVETAFGDPGGHAWVEENGVRFKVSLVAGQKTGWFYDQSANRRAFLRYVGGRRVLDVFSYLGAWGLAAARAGSQRGRLRGLLGARAGAARGIGRGKRPHGPHAARRCLRCARRAARGRREVRRRGRGPAGLHQAAARLPEGPGRLP